MSPSDNSVQKQSWAVKQYLEALEANRPRRGRKRTVETIQRQLADIEKKLADAGPFSRLQLIQERLNLEAELAVKSSPIDMTQLEDEFVKVGADFAKRKGISYAAWREAGVDAAVLKRAGIGRGGS